mgnify:FL=1
MILHAVKRIGFGNCLVICGVIDQSYLVYCYTCADFHRVKANNGAGEDAIVIGIGGVFSFSDAKKPNYSDRLPKIGPAIIQPMPKNITTKKPTSITGSTKLVNNPMTDTTSPRSAGSFER